MNWKVSSNVMKEFFDWKVLNSSTGEIMNKLQVKAAVGTSPHTTIQHETLNSCFN